MTNSYFQLRLFSVKFTIKKVSWTCLSMDDNLSLQDCDLEHHPVADEAIFE